MGRSRHGSSTPCTIVIKLGTSSIVHETTHQPLLSTLSSVVETVVKLREDGHRVVLVSSGAIGVGLKRMDMASRPKSLSGKQALAAIGQGRLIALWDNLFGQVGQPIAQILLTRGDISDRTRYLNAVNTLSELLSMGVVPIVNENDTVSVSEIKFGDNDTLSAITSSMLHADYLFLLTDVDGLYTSNPRKDPSARPIDVVTSIPAIRKQVSTKTLGSKLGTGGMETKLIAAEIATAAGVTTIICSSKRPENIFDIIEYNRALRSNPVTPPEPSGSDTEMEGTPLTKTPTASESSSTFVSEIKSVASSGSGSTPVPMTPAHHLFLQPSLDIVRPPHTTFMPAPIPLRDLKSWTSHTLTPSGSVVIDSGAHSVLSRRESGGRLLPAGVLTVEGTFASGQAVRIIVRRRKGGYAANGQRIEMAEMTIMTSSLSGDGEKVEDTTATERIQYSYANDSPVLTEPSTPNILPSASITSSIASLVPLNSITSSVSFDDESGPSSVIPILAVIDENANSSTPVTPPEESKHDSLPEDGEWEQFEVGRGLANYNSAQIMKVKGLKSAYIAQLLGYADSEYVVENITIRVPP